MHEWMDERMNERINEDTHRQMHEWQQTHKLLYTYGDKCMTW